MSQKSINKFDLMLQPVRVRFWRYALTCRLIKSFNGKTQRTLFSSVKPIFLSFLFCRALVSVRLVSGGLSPDPERVHQLKNPDIRAPSRERSSAEALLKAQICSTIPLPVSASTAKPMTRPSIAARPFNFSLNVL